MDKSKANSVGPLQKANEAMEAVSAALQKMNGVEREIFRKRHPNYLVPAASDSRLLALPIEIQGIILSLLPHETLRSLRLTCHFMLAACEPRFFDTLVLNVPFSNSAMYHKLQRISTSLPPGLKHVKHLRIQNQRPNCSLDPSEYSSSILMEEFPNEMDQTAGDTTSHRIKMLNTTVRSVLEKIPKQRLSTFVWYHQLPITALTQAIVLTTHAFSLKDFRISCILLTTPHNKPPFNVHYPKQLERIEVHNLSQNHTLLGKLIKRNHINLTHVTIGYASWLFDHLTSNTPSPSRPKTDSLKRVFRPHHSPSSNTTGSSTLVAPIRPVSLGLCCVDITTLVRPNGGAYIDWAQLQRLSLESCDGSHVFLEDLTSLMLNPDAQSCAPKLTHFRYRSEDGFRNNLDTTLATFLKSIHGLRQLSVLVGNAHAKFDMAGLIEIIGASLEVLVWETRVGIRHDPFISGSYGELDQDGVGNIFEHIGMHCPKLRELGLALDWGDGCQTDLMENLGQSGVGASLKNLRTLHVRNASVLCENLAAEAAVESRWTTRQEHNSLLNALHLRFAELFAQNMLENPDHLKFDLIAFGPMTYRERWHVDADHAIPDTTEQPVENRTTFFGVDYAWVPKLSGKKIPIIKEVGDGSVESIQDYTEHVKCFDSYWMQ